MEEDARYPGFWLGKGVDGFRCDMAEMVPIEFWEWVIPRVRSWKNVIFIAEVQLEIGRASCRERV